jgi:hypothetical protein
MGSGASSVRASSCFQPDRLTGVLETDEHIAIKVAYVICQKIIAAYADPNRCRGKRAMTKLIESIRRGVPAGLEEIAHLGRTLWRRRYDSGCTGRVAGRPTRRLRSRGAGGGDGRVRRLQNRRRRYGPRHGHVLSPLGVEKVRPPMTAKVAGSEGRSGGVKHDPHRVEVAGRRLPL